MNETVLKDECYSCTHFSLGDRDEVIKNFKSRDDAKGLENYLKEYAYEDEKDHNMRTYIVRYIKTGEIVAYFSLKAGLISIGKSRKKASIITYPGAEVANYSMNQNFIDKYPSAKGEGVDIFRTFVVPLIREVAESIGLKIIYIFSLPEEKVINNYYKYDFRRLESRYEKELHRRIKPGYDKNCIFMYQILDQ